MLVDAGSLAGDAFDVGLRVVAPFLWCTANPRTYAAATDSIDFYSGTVIEGTIKNVTDFGLFVGLDEGIDGLIHISDLSWTKKVKHPSEVLKKGQKVKAVILRIEPEGQRISLGLKQVQRNPWEQFVDEHPIGSVVEGEIRNMTEFGLFVGLSADIDGMVHISQLDSERVNRIEDVVNMGDEITVMVTDIDAAGKIRLSRRAVLEGLTVEQAREMDKPKSGGGDRPRGGGDRDRRSGGGGFPSRRPQICRGTRHSAGV